MRGYRAGYDAGRKGTIKKVESGLIVEFDRIATFNAELLNTLGYAYEQMMQCEKMFRDDEEFMSSLADVRAMLDKGGR